MGIGVGVEDGGDEVVFGEDMGLDEADWLVQELAASLHWRCGAALAVESVVAAVIEGLGVCWVTDLVGKVVDSVLGLGCPMLLLEALGAQ